MGDASGNVLKRNISELWDLMRTKHVCRKDGPLADRISKRLMYGGNQIPGTQSKIEWVREAPEVSAKQQKEGMKFRKQKYRRKSKKSPQRYKIYGADTNQFALQRRGRFRLWGILLISWRFRAK